MGAPLAAGPGGVRPPLAAAARQRRPPGARGAAHAACTRAARCTALYQGSTQVWCGPTRPANPVHLPSPRCCWVRPVSPSMHAEAQHRPPHVHPGSWPVASCARGARPGRRRHPHHPAGEAERPAAAAARRPPRRCGSLRAVPGLGGGGGGERQWRAAVRSCAFHGGSRHLGLRRPGAR